MRYVMLIYANPTSWEHPMYLQYEGQTDSERAELTREFDALLEEVTASGEWAGGERLAAPETTATVRVRDGAVMTTDGPYAESKEYLAGYLLLDCETRERAEQIAARMPDSRLCAVELRPVMVASGMEM